MKFNIEGFQTTGSSDMGSTSGGLGGAPPPPTLVEGQSYTCGTDAVFRAVGGVLRLYPTPEIAASWDPNWNTNILTIDCTGVSYGDPLDYYVAPAPSPAPAPAPAPAASSTTRALSSMKCVPLDLDNVIDSSGNIAFDADGNVLLSDVQAQRVALRQATQTNKVSLQNLQTYFAPVIAILLVLFLILYVVIPNVPIINQAYVFGRAVLPEYTGEIGFYGLIAMIFAFSGFLIGAAITSS
jgi:uncharacterized integral membrane protein